MSPWSTVVMGERRRSTPPLRAEPIAPPRLPAQAAPMRIDIALSLDEIVRLLGEATPLRVHLGEKDETRWVELERPSEVSLVPNLGLRIVAEGQLRYGVAGIKLPFAIRRAQLLLEPEVVSIAGGHERLDFKISVEQVDLEHVPGLAERVLESVVNDALTRLNLSWHFGRALELTFSLPERFEPLDELLLRPPAGRVTITPTELQFSMSAIPTLSRGRPRPIRD